MNTTAGIAASIAIIACAALGNLITRALPFALFGRQKEPPALIVHLGKFFPPAIIATLIIFCLKDVSFSTGSHGIPEIVSVLCVAVLHLWKKNVLISIGVGTVLYMVLIQFVFV